jgi:hypothetical protein
MALTPLWSTGRSPWSGNDLLSWDSSACPGQLTGRRTVRPSIDIAPGVHSCATCPPRFGSRGPPRKSCSVHVVFHHLDGFLRLEFAGLLHPAADHEVRRVSCSCRPEPAGEGGSVRSRDPRGAHRTPRRMFPVDSRSASPRSLPSCRWRAACGATVTPARCRVDVRVVADGCVGFRALLRRRVRGRDRIVADADSTRSFLGLGFPSRSILRTAGAPSSHRPTPTRP